MSEELINKIKQLSNDYQLDISKIKKWQLLLEIYPFYKDELAGECLEIICQRRVSCSIKIITDMKNGKPVESRIYGESLKESIEYAIYDTYGSEAEYYLSEEFRNEKGIKLDIDKYNYDYPDNYQMIR